MACDCKANRQIYELGKKYGNTVSPTRKDILKSGIWTGIQYVFLAIFAVLAAPVLFLMIVYRVNVRKEKVLNIGEIIGLKKEEHVGEQQNIQD